MGILIIDFSQVVISGLQGAVSSSNLKVLDEDLIRHLMLNSVRSAVFKFKKDYNNIIIACDSRNYWRKEVFPHYKSGRKKSRDNSALDWAMIFDVMTKVKQELKENFPYKVIEVDRAEADDIFGTLVPRLASNESIMMVSSDGDFKQLHQYGDVKQYSSMLKVFVKSPNPQLELKEKILTGDRGDGIPSCLSNDDVFVLGIRQKPLTAKIKERLLPLDFNDPTIEFSRNIQRNKLLIDLTMIPQDVKDAIIEEYEKDQTGSKNMIMKYMIKHRLSMLLECIDEF
jgi:hypothetical protein